MGFPKVRGPNIDPKLEGSYYMGTHKKRPPTSRNRQICIPLLMNFGTRHPPFQLVQKAIPFMAVGTRNSAILVMWTRWVRLRYGCWHQKPSNSGYLGPVGLPELSCGWWRELRSFMRQTGALQNALLKPQNSSLFFSLSPSLSPSIYLSIYLSVYPSIHPPFQLYIVHLCI